MLQITVKICSIHLLLLFGESKENINFWNILKHR